MRVLAGLAVRRKGTPAGLPAAVLDGLRHGQGTATYADGSVYTGQFAKGQREGKGEILMADGFKYVGEWVAGEINGVGGFGFMLSAIDGDVNGDGADKFRIKIWDESNDQVVYDNALGASEDADPPTELAGGSIVVHTGKGRK